MSKLLEIRWHGRAGQGVVTASELLAETALGDGKNFQAFPEYGPERMGAPIRAYTRISDSPIHNYSQIEEPDVVVVLDPSLLGVVDVASGLDHDGVLLVNTSLPPKTVREKSRYQEGKVYTLDATRIALDTMGRNVTNTPMLGALLRITDIVEREKVIHIFREKLGAKLKGEVVEANIQAFHRGYNEVQEG
jgi:pyruvate ferredoxin oxidoreductase gamma subunit